MIRYKVFQMITIIPLGPVDIWFNKYSLSFTRLYSSYLGESMPKFIVGQTIKDFIEEFKK